MTFSGGSKYRSTFFLTVQCVPPHRVIIPLLQKATAAGETFWTCYTPKGGAEVIRLSLLPMKPQAIFSG